MAYQPHQLSALSYVNGFTLWHYRTGDGPHEVEADGYFDLAVRMLRVGDAIMVNAGVNPGRPPSNGTLWVVTNTGERVGVAGRLVTTPFTHVAGG